MNEHLSAPQPEIVELSPVSVARESKPDFLDKLTEKVINRKVARAIFIASVLTGGAATTDALYKANYDYNGAQGTVLGTNIVVDANTYSDTYALGEAALGGAIFLTGVGFSVVLNKLATKNK